MVVRHGYQCYSWGNLTTKGDVASAAKPVIQTMGLFAVQEALISDMDVLISTFGRSLVTKDLSMTLRHLTNMTSGYGMAEDPGDAFAYNDYAVQLLAMTVFDDIFAEASPNTAALNALRFGAIGLEDGALFGSRGGYGVETSVRDLARIGLLWLNRGHWNGTQVLSAALMDEALAVRVPTTTPISSTGNLSGSDYLSIGTFGGDWNQSAVGPGFYGSAWWHNSLVGTTGNIAWPALPRDTFMAQGSFNQEFIICIPSLDIVCVGLGDWGTFDPGNAGASMNTRLGFLAAAAAGQIGQLAFRGRNDDGSETTATWKAAENTDFTVAPDATFRLRMQVGGL